MKAIVIDSFVSDLAELRPTDVSLPEPRGSEISVKISHAACTHVDMLYAQGLHQNNRRHIKPPFILGTEFAGIVTSSPPSSRLQIGSRVFGSSVGSFAENICVDEANVRRVPDQWSNAEACSVGVSGAVSWGALISMAKLKAGETVLLLGGSGGLGVIALQIAKAVGAKAIAVVGNDEKADLVKRLGADGVVNYHDENWEDAVKQLTENGQGFHVVYDAIGAVESALKVARHRGRIVIVGFAGRKSGDIERLRVNRILLKSATIHGYRMGEDGRRDPWRTKMIWDGFMSLVDSGKIRPVVYKERYRGVEDVPRALQDVKLRRTWGRVVLGINEDAEEKHKARL